MANFLIKCIPRFKKIYILSKLLERVQYCMEEVTFQKNHLMITENQSEDHQKYFYIVIRGELMLTKKISYKN